MNLVFATHNQHKFDEVSQMITNRQIELVSLSDIQCVDDIPEPYATITENAIGKAQFIKNKFKLDCFADDTALEIEALDGAPGVYSARFAGDNRDPEANMRMVLSKMEGLNNRKACFRTVIALMIESKITTFEGIIYGNIAANRKGLGGFGYDPIFIPDGYTQSFAEMPSELKNTISHRALAFQKLIVYLNQL